MHWRICTFERRVSSFHQLDVKAQRAIQNCLFAIHSIRGTRAAQMLHEQTSERWIVIVRDILCSSYTTLPRTTPRWKFTLIDSHKMSIRYTKFATHTTYKLCYQSRRQKKPACVPKTQKKSLKLSTWYMACCDKLEEKPGSARFSKFGNSVCTSWGHRYVPRRAQAAHNLYDAMTYEWCKLEQVRIYSGFACVC